MICWRKIQEKNRLDGLTVDLESANKNNLCAVFPKYFTGGWSGIDKLFSLYGKHITGMIPRNMSSSERARVTTYSWCRSSAPLHSALRQRATLLGIPPEPLQGDTLNILKLLQTSYFRKANMICIEIVIPKWMQGIGEVKMCAFAM